MTVIYAVHHFFPFHQTVARNTNIRHGMGLFFCFRKTTRSWQTTANLPIGFCDDSPDIRGHTIPANPTIERIGHTETLFIDLRKE